MLDCVKLFKNSFLLPGDFQTKFPSISHLTSAGLFTRNCYNLLKYVLLSLRGFVQKLLYVYGEDS